MFDSNLVNIMEYLAIGELEMQLNQLHYHESVLYDDHERQMVLQSILNHVPPVYMLMGEEDTPTLSLISTAEQDYLTSVVRQQLEDFLRTRSYHSDPYSCMMTEMFY
ncbi:MAG: hypothetical protein OHK0012_05880 [Synechococcales cyanobacterium]